MLTVRSRAWRSIRKHSRPQRLKKLDASKLFIEHVSAEENDSGTSMWTGFTQITFLKVDNELVHLVNGQRVAGLNRSTTGHAPPRLFRGL